MSLFTSQNLHPGMTHAANKTRICKDVEFLTEIRPYRNFRNLQTLEKVSRYISDEFSMSGFKVEAQKWTAARETYTNILASYNEKGTERLIIGAHYDVCGDQPGADDNASAVAGLLETARLLSAHKPDVDYRIDLVAYCLEEPPFFGTTSMGSYVHAESLHRAGVRVKGMICYEMIGYFSDEPNSQPYPDPALAKIYPDTANFIVVVGIQKYAAFTSQIHQLMSAQAGLDVQVICFPDNNDLAGLSDQRNYWKFGMPALMINDTAFVRNPNYHEVTDTMDTLDFDKLTEVVNSAYRAVIGL
jgi:Zn-dependent M28 family amino/carboxypeptidase